MGNKELQVRIINDVWSIENLMQEYRNLKEAFSIYVEHDDLGAAIRSLTGGHCPNEATLQSMINEVDGSIDLKDFLDLIARMRVPYSENELQKAFQFFSGRFQYNDSYHLYNVLRNLVQDNEKVETLVREAESYGKVNYDEFKKLITTIDVPRPYDLRTALLTAKTSEDKKVSVTRHVSDEVNNEVLTQGLQLCTTLKFEMQTDQERGFRSNADRRIRRKNRGARI